MCIEQPTSISGIRESRQIMALDSLPNEILQTIVSIAGTTNLIGLLSDKLFLSRNKNLKSAVNHEIEKKSKYKFDNRVTLLDMSNFGNWKESKSLGGIDHFRDTKVSNFMGVEEFKFFDDYCVEERLQVECTVRYEIQTIVDYFEFEKLVASLNSSKYARLALSVHIDHMNRINGSELLEKLTHLKDRVSKLSLDISSEFEHEINLDIFENLESLEISGEQYQGSLLNYRRLKELSRRFASLDITKLPLSLESLYIAHCDVDRPVSNPDALKLPILKHISFLDSDRYFSDDIEVILRYMISSEVKSITFEGEGTMYDDNWFLELLKDVANVKNFKLESLSVTGPLGIPLTIYPSRRLVFNNNQVHCPVHDWPTLTAIPNTLTELTLHKISFSLGELFATNPLGLKVLDLSNCSINFYDAEPNFRKFKTLRYLDLSENDIGEQILSFQFPDSVESLSLHVSRIESLSGVNFPLSLANLDVSSNNIQSLDGTIFPQSLSRLNITGNKIIKLRGDNFPLALQRLDVSNATNIDISKNRDGAPLQIESLNLEDSNNGSHYILPNSLQSIRLANINWPSNHAFAENLVRLKMVRCSIELRCSTFGSASKLQYLYMSGCNLKRFDINLPQSLKELHLNSNNLSEIPPHAGQLKNLRILRLDRNNITKASVEFSHNSLEVLDLSENQIEELQLSFPDGNTKLKQIYLKKNKLKEISMESIGHKGKSKHTRLYELVLEGNKGLSGEQVAALAPHLSKFARYLWGPEAGIVPNSSRLHCTINHLADDSNQSDFYY